MKPGIYLFCAGLLLSFTWVVFRRIVRRDYLLHGRLRALASTMQLLVFLGFFSFPYLFNPPKWPWFWRLAGSTNRALFLVGMILIGTGFLVSFGTMAWFGIKKALGLQVTGLTRQGPYQFCRNPQILGGYFLVIGVALQWPSIYMLGWALIYALITHWMVISEEEHLASVYGQAYAAYCAAVPRYIPNPWARTRR